MKTIQTILLLTTTLTSVTSLADSGASENASAASKYSALTASHGTLASAKLGSAVIAVPLIAAGASGNVALQAGGALMESATSVTPLQVTEKTITAAPSPAQAMKVNQQGNL
jgi:hypothetical protein